IPQEEREIIWERYQRCQHQGGRKKGTGIGLSIVSTFLKAHNMEYGVDCHDGYTTFWFECNIE
ncbi:MAG: two-component sensor histidine kinase, partial [Anaerotignaceae bacterium]